MIRASAPAVRFLIVHAELSSLPFDEDQGSNLKPGNAEQ
jgi:hypothetical protein